MNATAHDPALDALLADPGVAKAMREYRRADSYGKITLDHAAVVIARKVSDYAHRTLINSPDASDESSPLPVIIYGPLLDFLAAERARNDVISKGKLAAFSDNRKEVWDTMRSTAHALAQVLDHEEKN